MERRTESIVSMLAISPTDSEVAGMSKEQMKMEKLYQITMSMAKRMLDDGLISKEEYAIIDTEMKEKYRPTLGTLFADIDLI